MMRKQYYFRPSARGYFAWDVDRLIALMQDREVLQIPLSQITELDRPFVLEDSERPLTAREVAEHCRLVIEADLRYPIILSATGAVMDGMHRAMKALLEGRATIAARKFDHDPPPDAEDVLPDDLDYT